MKSKQNRFIYNLFLEKVYIAILKSILNTSQSFFYDFYPLIINYKNQTTILRTLNKFTEDGFINRKRFERLYEINL